MTDKPWIALGWECGQRTGWGQFGAHFARTCTNAGYRVILPGAPATDGVLPLDRPLLASLVGPIPESEPGWLCMAVGNGMEERPAMPGHIKVAGIIFAEDTGAIDAAKLNAYDLIVAGSRWTERVLKEKGVERVILAHQGYDSRVFFPDPNAYSQWNDSVAVPLAENQYLPEYPPEILAKWRGRPLVFSGGKLEFRKGQDIVVEAFKRFRQTPEGQDAVLVCAWENIWPQTMDGIWLSGYVKGVPAVKNRRLDLAPWLIANGLPEGSFVDCGPLSPPELAQVLRSCTVGIFPNRAESGTNLVLVEALASGLPCVTVHAHGHSDVIGGRCKSNVQVRDDGVPQGCRLYKSTEGWSEPFVDSCAGWLAVGGNVRPVAPAMFTDYWSWEVRGPAMAKAIVESQP